MSNLTQLVGFKLSFLTTNLRMTEKVSFPSFALIASVLLSIQHQASMNFTKVIKCQLFASINQKGKEEISQKRCGGRESVNPEGFTAAGTPHVASKCHSHPSKVAAWRWTDRVPRAEPAARLAEKHHFQNGFGEV